MSAARSVLPPNGFADFSYSFAASRDLAALKELLSQCGLPSEDVDPHLRHFILARVEGGLAGAVGLEPLGSTGLFRSLAVRPDQRGKGVAATLCEQMFIRARSSGVTRLYLLTTSAEKYFEKIGFSSIPRTAVPAEIRATKEFSDLCPQSSAVMTKKL